MASDMFSLKSDSFEAHSSNAFRDLREDKDFLDVTLSCGDEQLQAHKVIISACSPFFRDVLRKNPHAHPLLYLKGVKYTCLQSILTYMYCGEVTLRQEDLASFIDVAEDLKVKGLTQVNPATNTHTAPQLSEPVLPTEKPLPPPSSTPKQEDANIQEAPTVATDLLQQWYGVTAPQLQRYQTWKQELYQEHNQIQEGLQNQPQEYQDIQESQENFEDEEPPYEDSHSQYQEQYIDGGTDDVPGETLVVKPNNNCEELDETIYSKMLRLQDGRYSCIECGKILKGKTNLKFNMVRHIENKHIEGILHPCNKCGRSFKSRHILACHMSKKHKEGKGGLRSTMRHKK